MLGEGLCLSVWYSICIYVWYFIAVFLGPPATGGVYPPMDLSFKSQNNGFSEAPQTWQVPRMFLGANFGKKIFQSHDPLGPPWLLQKGGNG